MSGVALLLMSLVSLPLRAQEDRAKLIVNDSGATLVVHSLSDGLELRIRPLSGPDTILAADGEVVATSQGPFSVVGFGASPDFNDSGFATFMGGFGGAKDAPDVGLGIFRASGTGLTIVAEGWGGADGTPLAGGTICHFEPMPAINSLGQIAFGFNSDIDGGVEVGVYSSGDCEDLSASEAGVTERKGVARWTSPSTLIKYFQSGDTISVGLPYRATSATYTITKTGFTHNGGTVFNATGHAVAEALLDNDFTVRADGGASEDPDLDGLGRTYIDDRTGLFYLRGASDYLLIAATGPDSIFQEVEWPVLNDAGQVLFKGVERTGSSYCGLDGYGCTEADSSLNLWTVAGGLMPIVDTDAGTASVPSRPPGSDPTTTFQGFSPMFDMNNSGQVLFSGGLIIDGEADDGDSDGGDYRVVMLREPDGTLRELARTAAADAAEGGGFDSSIGGLVFDIIGASTTLADSGNAFFIVESYDGIDDNPCTVPVETDWLPDGDELTAVVGWDPLAGLSVLLREGQLFNGFRVMEISATQPHLRDHTNDDRALFVKVRFDVDGDCVAGDPDDQGVFAWGGPIVPRATSAIPAIPAVSLPGMLLLGALLAATGLIFVRLAS